MIGTAGSEPEDHANIFDYALERDVTWSRTIEPFLVVCPLQATDENGENPRDLTISPYIRVKIGDPESHLVLRVTPLDATGGRNITISSDWADSRDQPQKATAILESATIKEYRRFRFRHRSEYPWEITAAICASTTTVITLALGLGRITQWPHPAEPWHLVVLYVLAIIAGLLAAFASLRKGRVAPDVRR